MKIIYMFASKKTFKVFLILISFFLFLFSPTKAYGQNKAGIHIGDQFKDFDKAAKIVGPGGWVVIMACPGDADKIAQMAQLHPEVNIAIRGHYPGTKPDEKLAKLWAAALGSIPSSGKFYFIPWNEPNQAGSADWVEPEYLVSYTKDLVSAFSGIRGKKVVLLSPMLNHTWKGGAGDFDSYVQKVRSIQNNYFSQFDGISMNLYDIADGCGGSVFCSNDPHLNALLAPQLLSIMGASGKSVYGIESGTAANNFYWMSPPNSSSPLYKFAQRFIKETSATMFAIPSYDLGGEKGHSWTLFDPPDVIELLKSSSKGGINPASGPISNSLKKCPEKFYSFYITDKADCTECGTMMAICQPLKVDEFGEEKSRQSINLSQEAKYNYLSPKCITGEFSGQVSLENFEIPFARELNRYFLGPYLDNPKARSLKEETEGVKDYGVFEKLAPKEYQDTLKLRFIDEVYRLGTKSRYFGYRIEGKTLKDIKSTFEQIQNKQKKGEKLSGDEEKFIKLVWIQVPLFGNEESEGEVIFYGSDIDPKNSRLKTSVPEVYRLNKVAKTLMTMLGAKEASVSKDTIVPDIPVSKESCPQTIKVDPDTNSKAGISGSGDEICTKPKIQTTDSQIAGKRTFINDAFEACSEDAGGCGPLSDENKCCGNGKKCVIASDGLSTICGSDCPGGCWYPGKPNDNTCCVKSFSDKTKTFTDANINSVNRVPYLKTIAENLVGKGGFFSLFIPGQNIQSGEAQNAFKEVVGESNAQLAIKTKVKDTKGYSFTVNNVNSSLTLLFHKLGTMIKVERFVSGKVLWPFGSSNGSYSPGEIPENMAELFRQAGSANGVPPKILEAVMQVESPDFLKKPKSELDEYLAGTPIRGCGPNVCSATGPMQMTTGTDNSGSNSCSQCCDKGNCLTQCPNAWADFGQNGNPCILKDNVYGAARKLKNNSGASSSTNWSRDEVFKAITSYYGECSTSFARLDNKTYCQYVWDYYQAN